MGYLAIALAIVAGALYLSASSPTAAIAPDSSEARAAVPAAAIVSSPGAPARAVAAASSSVPAPPGAAATTASGLAAPAMPPVPQVSRTRDPEGDTTPDLSDYVNKGERPTMAEVIDRLHQAGVHGGLGAFAPPGSRPPLVGLAVPEDFVLPEGYVRHHQATDDGQRIEPILMFAPDHRFFDAAHRPIEVPKDRVVPAELAPPGLPIRRIVIPAPTEPGRPGS